MGMHWRTTVLCLGLRLLKKWSGTSQRDRSIPSLYSSYMQLSVCGVET